MNKAELLKKLDSVLDEWERTRAWGTIEIEVHDGAVSLLRKETKEKFTTGGHNHVPRRETR
jgi:hypothetical protein